MDLAGEKYAVAMTPDELAEVYFADPDRRAGRTFQQIRREIEERGAVGRPACFYDGESCTPYNGCTSCTLHFLGGGVYDCACDHS
jgi:hypothetical protein